MGNAPGKTKVTTASERGIPMIDYRTLWKVLRGKIPVSDAQHHSIEADSITKFSDGDDYFKLGFKVNSSTPKKKKEAKIQSTTLDHFFGKTGSLSPNRTST